MHHVTPSRASGHSHRRGFPTRLGLVLLFVAAQPARASFNAGWSGLLAELAVGGVVYLVLMGTWFAVTWGLIALALSGPLRTSHVASRRWRRITMVVATIVWFTWPLQPFVFSMIKELLLLLDL